MSRLVSLSSPFAVEEDDQRVRAGAREEPGLDAGAVVGGDPKGVDVGREQADVLVGVVRGKIMHSCRAQPRGVGEAEQAEDRADEEHVLRAVNERRYRERGARDRSEDGAVESDAHAPGRERTAAADGGRLDAMMVLGSLPDPPRRRTLDGYGSEVVSAA
jgi:hypothetical protein